MPTRLSLDHLTLWITAAAREHSLDLASHIEERTGASRRAALAALRKLVDANWLSRSGSDRRPVYGPGQLRQVARSYTLYGLQEDIPWQRDFAPHFALPPHVLRMVRHGFTELVNNAADHSGGSSVTVSLRQTPSHVQLLVSDDGCGVFDKICQSFDIADAQHAMLELSKGRLTSQPEQHTGRGLFFSSQLADVFDIHANGTAFQRRAWESNGWRPGRPMPRQGSSIYMAVALDTTRTLDQVMQAWSVDGSGIEFDQTTIHLSLLAGEGQALDSRAQARRVAARLGTFRRAEISFAGVEDVGHGFTDELFRVFARAHKEVDLVPTHMTPRIAALVKSAQQFPS
ncbi:ATP-binding protein [Roseateles koreensis]|uniref:ATP-binding protein n=1 Tax=Roseateles koreensis TaxID=2987526 RepID=A0ABT5KQ62_9BURK|nr:ATP-binding protein [Roseateles koreensis]MDC8784600.1 ATP-binding protein [Roseateles koreensis]